MKSVYEPPQVLWFHLISATATIRQMHRWSRRTNVCVFLCRISNQLKITHCLQASDLYRLISKYHVRISMFQFFPVAPIMYLAHWHYRLLSINRFRQMRKSSCWLAYFHFISFDHFNLLFNYTNSITINNVWWLIKRSQTNLQSISLFFDK